MQCISIEIVNFCNHPYRKEVFDDGLIAVIGANGAGKSNFLGAISFAITGENPNVGTKEKNIYGLASEDSRSYVELVFRHGGVTATVRRNIRPNRPTATLELSTGERCEGDRDVNNRITELLGIGLDVFTNVVVAAQKDIYGFIDETEARRGEQFQKLFDTSAASRLHKLLGARIKSIEIPSVAVDKDKLKQDRQTAVNQRMQLELQLQQLPSFDDIQKNRDANADVIRKQQERQQLDNYIQSNNQTISNFEARVAALQGEESQAEKTLVDLQNLDAEGKDAVAEARAALQMLSRVNSQRAAVTAAANRVTDFQKQLQNLTPPTQPENYVADAGTIDTQELANKEYQLNAFINSFSGGVANCPTCGTPAETLQGKLQEAREEVATVSQALQSLRQQIQASTTYDEQVRVYENSRSSLESQLAQAEQALTELPQQEDIDIDENAVNQLLREDSLRQQSITTAQDNLSNIRNELSNLTGQISATKQNVVDMMARLAALPAYTQLQMEQAQQNIAGWDTAADNRRKWESSISVADTQIINIDQQLAAAAKAEQQADFYRNWRGFLTDIRAVFHKDAAPKFVAQRNLEILAQAMNEQLRMFQTSYYLTAADDLSFNAHFSNGIVQPVNRLSGGQKVIVVLAWRLSLNLLYAGEIGALYLDEPTAYLDAEHIRSFEPVLDKLRELTSARGLQCIIITHERDLAPMFDSVIQL